MCLTADPSAPLPLRVMSGPICLHNRARSVTRRTFVCEGAWTDVDMKRLMSKLQGPVVFVTRGVVTHSVAPVGRYTLISVDIVHSG